MKPFCQIVVLPLLMLCFLAGCGRTGKPQAWRWFDAGAPDVIIQATILEVDSSKAPRDGGTFVHFRVDRSQKGHFAKGTKAIFSLSQRGMAMPKWHYKGPFFQKGQRWLLCLHQTPSGSLYAKYAYYSFRIDPLIEIVRKEHPDWQGPIRVERTGVDSYNLDFIDPAGRKAPPSVFIRNGKIVAVGRM